MHLARRSKLPSWLLVALGSAVGGVGRYAISVLMTRVFGPRFPFGTLLVNGSGAPAIGVYMGALAPDAAAVLHPPPPLGLTFGVPGAYTTFSSFSLETRYLTHDERYRAAAAYVGLSVALCVGAAGLGWHATG
ncbi:MAG: fluoride efflux transporter CrcB [Bacteroidetes bacterium]|nr:fluoride efflux transporter CrcB [Bacteroidota bacterium]